MLSQIALVLALLGQTEYKPGDRVYLHSGRGDEVPVVTNFLWVEDFWKSGNAQDAEGMKRLLGDGKMVFLPDDTEALIIQSLPVPNPGPELSFTKVHEVRVKADKYYVFEPWLITPSARPRESQRRPPGCHCQESPRQGRKGQDRQKHIDPGTAQATD